MAQSGCGKRAVSPLQPRLPAWHTCVPKRDNRELKMAPVVAEALGFSAGCGRGLRQPGALVGHSVGGGAGLDGGVVCVARAFCTVARSSRTLCDPWTATRQASLSVTKSQSLLKLMSIVGDAVQPYHPLSSSSPPTFSLSQHQGFSQSHFFASGGQSTGTSASASVLPVNIEDWFL